MNRVIIVQARMTSTRLPGKVLADLGGRPMLARQIERLRHCRQVDQIVIATTVNATDDPVAALAEDEKLTCCRGSENDVLSRYVEAARVCRADIVIRITADCPMIDAEITDQVIKELIDHTGSCEYACNILERTYPRGLDVEALTRDALERCHREATSAEDREHVTLFIRRDLIGLFACRSIRDYQDNSDLRWTVDTQTDLELIRRIYRDLDLARTYRPYRQILDYVRAHPDLATANITQKTWDPSKDKQGGRQ
jgi:spore coat polysaccharide biosynthesis protein SpsF